jgi:hypothetical protein
MNNIGVCIYSYQGKNLIKTISEIKEKSSKTNMLYFYIIDQNNIDRTRSLDDPDFHLSIVYKHIKWDSIKSPISYKQEAFKLLNKTYFMQISDDVSLSQDWDLHAINFLNDKPNSIISGNSTVDLKNKNLFMVKAERTPSRSFNKINYIDRDFIFCKTEDLIKIDYPTSLKYCGEEESISINLIDKEISVYNFPDEYLSINKKFLEEEYTPFSLTHNYNEFVNEYANKIQKNFNIVINPLPFEDNDVSYDISQSQIDRMGGLRYINKIKEIR